MYCKNCGNKIEENTKFCGNCGERVQNDTPAQEVRSEAKDPQDKSDILHVITGINNPSITFSGANGHWGIIFTADAIYFVKNSSSSWYQGNPGIVFGAVGGAVGYLVKSALLRNKEKTNTNDLSSILKNSKIYYKFTISQLNQINVKKLLYKYVILLSGVESKTLEIFVSKDQYNNFIENIKKLYNHNLV